MISKEVLRFINNRIYTVNNTAFIDEPKIKIVKYKNRYITGIHSDFEIYLLYLAANDSYYLDGWKADFKHLQKFENCNAIINSDTKFLVIFKNNVEKIKFKLKYG